MMVSDREAKGSGFFEPPAIAQPPMLQRYARAPRFIANLKCSLKLPPAKYLTLAADYSIRPGGTDAHHIAGVQLSGPARGNNEQPPRRRCA
jgi:hypothetical protein